MELIEDHFASSSFGPRDLAQRLGTRPDVLAALFHKTTGETPRDCLRDRRLDHAAQLLIASRHSVKEVWAAVGYNHASNFCHDFRARFGLSPAQFRQQQPRLHDTRLPPPVELNRRTASDSPNAMPISDSIGLGRLRILIIDDNVGTRTNIAAHFKGQPRVSITLAETGAEGVRLAIQNVPTVIVLDYHLADMDGLKCLEALRYEGIRAPVVIFSADVEVEELTVEFSTRQAVFVSKLCDLEMLEHQIRNVVRMTLPADRIPEPPPSGRHT